MYGVHFSLLQPYSPDRQQGYGAENTQALGIVSMRPLLFAVVVY
jgi:hypothetical protein